VVIDFHTHILPPSFRRDRAALLERDATFAALFGGRLQAMATAEELVEAMDADGVDVSVAVGYGWCDQGMARESNHYLLDAARRYPGRIAAFCSVHPGWGDDALKEVERCVALGAVGIGELHPTSQRLDLATSPALEPLMELAHLHGLPVMVHGSEPVGHAYPGKGNTTPVELMAFAGRFPENTIIAAHWGGGLPFYGLMPEVRDALANVYFDTATSPFLYRAEVFPVVVQAAGAERVLFGSDYPLLRASRVLQEARDTLFGVPVTLEAVLHGNASKLLTL
jgi:predicted TIM-barrel fold metal-dependent hydrolase